RRIAAGVARTIGWSVVIEARPSADDECLFTAHVVCGTEPRRYRERRPVEEAPGDSLSWSKQSVGGASRVRHEGADRERRIRPQQLTCDRVHRLAIGARAWIGAVGAAGH